MTGVIVKNTPFASWEEWTRLKASLFSCSIEDKVQGLLLAKAWRCRGSLPAAVECTVQLVEATLCVTKTGPLPSQALESERMLLALALIRAVNIIVEPSQQGYYAIPVSQLAEKVGLPGWIVELRHDATHRLLPSLTLLRSACQFLLDWFRQNYWEMQWQELLNLSLTCVECARDPVTNSIRTHLKQPTFLMNILIPLILSDMKSIKTFSGDNVQKWLNVLQCSSMVVEVIKASLLCEVREHLTDRIDGKTTGDALAIQYQQIVVSQAVKDTTTPWKQLIQSKSDRILICAAAELAKLVNRSASCCNSIDDINNLVASLVTAADNNEQTNSALLGLVDKVNAADPPNVSTLNEMEDWISNLSTVGRKRSSDAEKKSKNKSRRIISTKITENVSAIQEIQIKHDYGVWPLGLVAGRRDCSELWKLEIVNDNLT